MSKVTKPDLVEFGRGSRLDFANGCLVMGVLNVTPDSFSDGGEYMHSDKAVERGIKMVREGAAIIDVGGESTRPGSQRVSVEEQIQRVVPVIEKLTKQVEVPVSIDAYDYEVVKAAVDAGAEIVNDITGLEDEGVGRLAAERGLAVVLMHMQGQPETMQKNPEYGDVVEEVLEFLLKRGAKAKYYGIPEERVFIDPGIGFGKTVEHNLELLKRIGVLVSSPYRVLVGPSRKGFIGTLTGREETDERVFGTAGVVGYCAGEGVSIVRVHDVRQMVDVVRMVEAIKGC